MLRRKHFVASSWESGLVCSLFLSFSLLRFPAVPGPELLLPSGSLPPCDWLMAATSLGKGQAGALRESSTISNLTVIALKIGAMHTTPDVGI